MIFLSAVVVVDKAFFFFYYCYWHFNYSACKRVHPPSPHRWGTGIVFFTKTGLIATRLLAHSYGRTWLFLRTNSSPSSLTRREMATCRLSVWATQPQVLKLLCAVADRAQKRLDMRSMSQTFTRHPSRHSIFKMADDESKTNTSYCHGSWQHLARSRPL